MDYAEVSVNSPLARRLSFSYGIPPGLDVKIGQAVWVPFGDKRLQGIVLELTDHPQVSETKDISGVIESRPLLSPTQVRLARWISEYYLAPLFDAVAPMLPPGFKRRIVSFLSRSEVLPNTELASLSSEQRRVFDLLEQKGRVSLAELEKMLGKRKARSVATALVRGKLAVRTYELKATGVKPKLEPYLKLAVSVVAARQAIADHQRRAPKQATLLEFITRGPQPVSWREARRAVPCDKAVLNALVSKGLVTVTQVIVRRRPFSQSDISPQSPIALTSAQGTAFEAISQNLESRRDSSAVFLLHGVTGSGKTEVYLRALARAVARGKKGLVLVPEIALTPQTIERFAARFPHRVAVLHSRLSLGEQFDEWWRIHNGEVDVVIGSRSAIFAPQPDLGLIIIDEEHEWTYKQTEGSPRYHARAVAIKLAELNGAAVVLGSATPDVETFYHAQSGDYHYLELSERVVPHQGAPLPAVEVVDLRRELKAGNRSIFSRMLSRSVAEATAANGQVILFLNRRGGATFVQCRSCGHTLSCRRCAATLTYHFDSESLVCHQCNYRTAPPQTCPRCHSRRIKFLGVGTQKLGQVAREAFPRARLLRWDSDVTRTKGAHREILDKFRNREADILIGTQMVAKGLDLPGVTLVGIVNADIGLNLPDFRAGERTFQLLSQVLGRAGRGRGGGKVVIQTYFPEHYAIQAAAKHDYRLFYEQEIEYRRKLGNPPFNQLARLTLSHANDEVCQRGALDLKRRLIEEADSRGVEGLSLIGPAPAFIHRLRERYRWQIILRGLELPEFLSRLSLPSGWTLDIDPVGLG